MKYLLASFFVFFFCFGASAQVFFKQRVYGNEKREKNTLSTVEVDNSTQIGKVKINGQKYKVFNTATSEWQQEPISFNARTGKFYLEKSKKAVHWRIGRVMLKDMGEKGIVNSLDRSRPGVIVGRGIQGFTIMGTLTVLPLLATEPTSTLLGIGVLGGIWFGGRTLVRFSRMGVKKRLENYNSNLEKTDKNFYQNIKPSSLTFKPVRVNLLNSSITPTLGFSWKL
jgi:hypothetical protein